MLVIMGRRCLGEQLYFLSKGHPQKAFRRKSKQPVTVHLADGHEQLTWYYRPGELDHLLNPHFRRSHLENPSAFSCRRRLSRSSGGAASPVVAPAQTVGRLPSRLVAARRPGRSLRLNSLRCVRIIRSRPLKILWTHGYFLREDPVNSSIMKPIRHWASCICPARLEQNGFINKSSTRPFQFPNALRQTRAKNLRRCWRVHEPDDEIGTSCA